MWTIDSTWNSDPQAAAAASETGSNGRSAGVERPALRADDPPAISQKSAIAALWIDDTPDDSLVRYLGVLGVHVHYVPTGTEGLAHARNRVFDVIVVDLRLPDIHGLSVIERLRGDGIDTPLLAVTGHYLDTETERYARASGAWEVRYKPLWAEEVADDLRLMTSGQRVDGWPTRPELSVSPCELAPGTDRDEQSDPVVRRLHACLARAHPLSGRIAEQSTRDRFILQLLTTLTEPGLTLAGFHACAQALRPIWQAPRDARVNTLAAETLQVLRDLACRPLVPQHHSVRTALDMLLREPRWWSEEDLARPTGVSPSHLGRLILRDLGLEYRKLRRRVVMKAGVVEILTTDEQVAQVAYRLGMLPGVFDQVFSEMFGCCPRELRRQWRSLAGSTPGRARTMKHSQAT